MSTHTAAETPEALYQVEATIDTGWANPPTILDLKGDFQDARVDQQDQVTKIDRWLDNLNTKGQALPAKRKGRSQIVPKLIRKQAEWRYASLTEPFLSTDDLFNVDPVTYEDKERAVQNALVLNNQFNTKIDKVAFIDEYVRAAVDEGTAIVRVGWDYKEEQVEEEVPVFEYVEDPNSMQMHSQFHQLMQMNPQMFEQLPEHMRKAHELTMRDGVFYVPEQIGTRTETVTKVVKNNPTIEVCDYRNIIIDPSCNGVLKKARFLIHSFETSLSELEEDGRYTNLDKINVEGANPLADPDNSSSTEMKSFSFKDQPRKRLVVNEYWGFWDINKDGTVVPIVAAWVGDTMIRMEENPFPDKEIPFVAVPYLPVRRSVYGEPDGELLEDNQKIMGALLRGMIDVMGRSANGQQGIRKDALDLVNRRKYDRGEDYEFNAHIDPRQAMHMHTYPEIPASAQFVLGMNNAEAESLTGVKAFNNGISGQALGDTATGIRGALDAASKRELNILRRLAKGIVEIGRKVMSMNAEFLSDEEIIRVTNDEFVPVRRDDLSGSYDLKLSISTAEEDNAKAQELSFMLQTVGPNTDPKIVYTIMADIARLRKMPSLAKKLEEYEPQPDPIAQQKAMLEIELIRAQIQEITGKAAKTGAEIEHTAAKTQSELAKTRNLDSETDLNNLEYVETESGVTQERELQKHGAQARANQDLEALKSMLSKVGQPAN